MRLLCFLLLLPVFTLAQSKPGTIKGAVVDSVSRKPLLEANVSLLRSDSSLVTFQSAGGEGEFLFRNVAPGNYRLLVTYVG